MGARKGCSRLETYGKYGSARQWCWCQRQLRGVARSLAQWAGQLSLEYEWKDRVVREERQRRVALGMSQVREAEAMGQRGLLTAAKGGLGLVHAFARGKHSILQHATTHVKMMAEAQQQAAHAIQVRATRHVLHTEARGRAHVAAMLLALHSILINDIAQRKALVLEDALHRRMYAAAARRDLAYMYHMYHLDRNPPCRQQDSPNYRITPCP